MKKKQKTIDSVKLIDRLKAWREKNELSQSQAAERIGIPRRTLENWEGGVNRPRGLVVRWLDHFLRSREGGQA